MVKMSVEMIKTWDSLRPSVLKTDSPLSKTQIRPITWKRYEIVCKFVSFTNRKLHTGFQLVPKSLTLNDLERRNDRRPALSLR